MNARRVAGLCAALLLALTACGGESEVGQGLAEFENQGLNRLGEFTPAPEAEGGTLGVGEPEKQQDDAGAQQAEQERQQQNSQQEAEAAQADQPAVSFDITQAGYDPYFIQVFQGGVVKVTNRDAQAHTVTADKGAFDSGSIAPGATWTLKADLSPGDYNFHDGTRPYVVGTLRVLEG